MHAMKIVMREDTHSNLLDISLSLANGVHISVKSNTADMSANAYLYVFHLLLLN